MSSSALTNADKKYWTPNEQIVKKVSDLIPEGSSVLEVGPGHLPFYRATHFVERRPDVVTPKETTVSVDLNDEALPFGDKSFDFIYCRHVLEDMYNPFHLLREMQRVGKAGYIETPSPIAELGRGVDGSSPPFRGYHHHSYIVWAHEGELRFVSKYPILEYFRFTEEEIVGWLREGPICWNTHFLWNDTIKWVHRQDGPDYHLTQDYAPMLKSAMDQARTSSGLFWMGLGKTEIKQTLTPAAA